MTIDSIITEWRFRLPKGYPTCAKDYKTLYEVILEMTDITPLEAQRIITKAQGLSEGVITEQSGDVEITSIYSGRVFRVATSNAITVYSEQPFDDHDFDINDAAANLIDGVSIDLTEFQQTINLNLV